MTESQAPRAPQSGETLILPDGRRFHLSSAEVGARGWWFTATAQDGASTLQGNLALDWDPQHGAWCMAMAVTPGASQIPDPVSMRRPPSSKRRQPD